MPPPQRLFQGIAQLPLARYWFKFENKYAARAEKSSPLARAGYEFLRFGVKQAWACLFGGLMLALILGTSWFYPKNAFISRYDFLFLAAIVIQAGLIYWKMETFKEAKIIFMFHIVGTMMEIFKTHAGSWIYPEAAFFRVGGVPLFTGFMYACVGSYLARVMRLFDIKFRHYPPLWITAILAVLIYINFFSHHYIFDFRWLLFAALAIIYRKTWVYFRVWQQYRKMPQLLGFFLVALFIWFAENIGTLTGTWLYPSQLHGWSMVSFSKVGAWFLLMNISFVMVTMVNKPEEIEVSLMGKNLKSKY